MRKRQGGLEVAIRLVVADDSEVVRAGVTAFVAGNGIRIVGEAKDERQALDLVRQTKPDVVSLDVIMPKGGEGLSALSRIKIEHPSLPVVMFSGNDSPMYVARSVALGASGYLSKTIGAAEFVDSIHRAFDGETLFTRSQLRRLGAALATPRPVDLRMQVALTNRELDVLARLCNGGTNDQVARHLGISYETVREHLQNIFRKIGVRDRTQAAIWAVRNGLDHRGPRD